MRYMLVDTDNLGGDYPDESFLAIHPGQRITHLKRLPYGATIFNDKTDAQVMALFLNPTYEGASRYIKVVEEGYKLQPGFEP